MDKPCINTRAGGYGMDNPCAKTRPAERPYEVWKSGEWTWYVLKKYQPPHSEKKDPLARWYCRVVSPNTPEGELVDVFVWDVLAMGAEMVSADYD